MTEVSTELRDSIWSILIERDDESIDWTVDKIMDAIAEQRASDWFAGSVDCDGNELTTIRADEYRKLIDDKDKLTWQVRDTCARAEKAEAAIAGRRIG